MNFECGFNFKLWSLSWYFGTKYSEFVGVLAFRLSLRLLLYFYKRIWSFRLLYNLGVIKVLIGIVWNWIFHSLDNCLQSLLWLFHLSLGFSMHSYQLTSLSVDLVESLNLLHFHILTLDEIDDCFSLPIFTPIIMFLFFLWQDMLEWCWLLCLLFIFWCLNGFFSLYIFLIIMVIFFLGQGILEWCWLLCLLFIFWCLHDRQLLF